MIGQGATELDSFAGSSNILYGSFVADEFLQVGVSGSYGWGVNEDGQIFRDPNSGTGVVAMHVGASVGVNGIANGVDPRGGISGPGMNSSRVINSAEDFMELVDDVKEALPSGTCALGQCFKWK